MAYRKLLVDNVTCSRRFHITFDDESQKVAKVELTCAFCKAVIFSKTDHPVAKIAREENLVQTAELSDDIVSECFFRDTMSEKTQPKRV